MMNRHISGRKNCTGGRVQVAIPEKRFESRLESMKRNPEKGLNIVAIGGGTGLSTLLRGLKVFTSNITAIVTVADDGGGSGILRRDLGIIPPGDIRNCILALAHTEPLMEKLIQYRFKKGMLKGQSFGNLFLAAMNGISESFEQAIRRVSDVLAVKGRVLPVSLDDIMLCAELEDGFIIKGESAISKHNSVHPGRIKRIYLEPEKSKAMEGVAEAIAGADAIVLGPGSLYTSIIPNLLVDGIPRFISEASAHKVYVCNIMTQPGETDGYTASDHIRAIEEHSCAGIVQSCIVNTSLVPDELLERYKEEGACQVYIDRPRLSSMGIDMVEGDIASYANDLVRHDSLLLAEMLINLIESRKQGNNVSA
jgi:uncharacterized cofD-like protein